MDVFTSTRPSLPGHFRLSAGRTPRGEGYSGEVWPTRDGEAWRCAWHRESEEGQAEDLEGVAICIGNVIFAGRSRNIEHQPSPGIVVYKIQGNGDLPARWYHPDLQGRLGEGLSTDGPEGQFVGRYRAEYSSATGTFDPLVKELIQVGDFYHCRSSRSPPNPLSQGGGHGPGRRCALVPIG